MMIGYFEDVAHMFATCWWMTDGTYVRFVRVDDFPIRYKLVRTTCIGITAALTQCFPYLQYAHHIRYTSFSDAPSDYNIPRYWWSCMVGCLNITLLCPEYFWVAGPAYEVDFLRGWGLHFMRIYVKNTASQTQSMIKVMLNSWIFVINQCL